MPEVKNECTKCKCIRCRRNESIFIKLGSGTFFVDADMCLMNKIKVTQNDKDISGKCVGIVALEPKWFNQV